MSIRAHRAGLLVMSFAVAACADSVPTEPARGLSADAAAVACSARANNSAAKLTECVTIDAVRAHQASLQAIADANAGTRASGTAGYDASAAYVAAQLTQAGYSVTLQPLTFTSYTVLESELEQISPAPRTYVRDVDFRTMAESPSGDVTAAVAAVDVSLGLGNISTSGCDAADFAGFPAGSIALLQRSGQCTFAVMAGNAQSAGATAVIIFNQGNTVERQGLISGTLTASSGVTIPVMEATYGLGAEWVSTPGLTMRVYVNASSGPFTTHNVLAELAGTKSGQIVMAGAHLDGVRTGPGINDNGSGAAALLETAIQMARARPHNTVRFAWWAAHEVGLGGSAHYVGSLSAEQLNAIALYLDFHMLGSPNYVRFVLDGDGSSAGGAGPAGSAVIESILGGFYTARGLAYEPMPLSSVSDFADFAAAGIPIGGISTGSSSIKTPAEASIYGGVAGEQYDPCYHLACDTFDNVSLEVLDLNADLVASAVLTFSMSTEAVNGVRGRKPVMPAAAKTAALTDR